MAMQRGTNSQMLMNGKWKVIWSPCQISILHLYLLLEKKILTLDCRNNWPDISISKLSKEVFVEQDNYPVCCNTDEQLQNNWVRNSKHLKTSWVILVQMRCKRHKKRGITYKVIPLAATLALPSKNGTSHPKTEILKDYYILKHILDSLNTIFYSTQKKACQREY